MKKAAIMLYPLFSIQEISCTTELFKFYDKEIVTFAAGREPVKSEDGFTVLPDRALEDYIQVIRRSAEKRQGEEPDDPLRAAVEKNKADKKKKGNGGKHS